MSDFSTYSPEAVMALLTEPDWSADHYIQAGAIALTDEPLETFQTLHNALLEGEINKEFCTDTNGELTTGAQSPLVVDARQELVEFTLSTVQKIKEDGIDGVGFDGSARVRGDVFGRTGFRPHVDNVGLKVNVAYPGTAFLPAGSVIPLQGGFPASEVRHYETDVSESGIPILFAHHLVHGVPRGWQYTYQPHVFGSAFLTGRFL